MRWMLLIVLCFTSCQLLRPKKDLSASFEDLQAGIKPNISEQDRENFAFYKTIYDVNFDKQFVIGHEKIPKIVHFIWLGPKPFPLASVENLRHWKCYHPDWKFIYWTDRERVAPLKGMEVRRIEDLEFRSLKAHYNESTNWAEKSDILRLEVLAKMGGVYVDHDADCLRSFEFLHAGLKFYAGLEPLHDPIDGHALTLGIGIIGAAAEHPIILEAMRKIESRWALLTKRFQVSSDLENAQRVAYRTYIAVSDAANQVMRHDAREMMIFPSHYFYPVKGEEGLYSTHHYATSWNAFGEKSQAERNYRMLEPVMHEETHLFNWILILSSVSLVSAFIFIRGRQ